LSDVRLVYTTDKKHPFFINNTQANSFEVQDAGTVMRETIHLLNKSRRRKAIMDGKKFHDREESRKKVNAQVELIVKDLYLKSPKRKFAEIYTLLFGNVPRDKVRDKYLQNLLQMIRYASDQIIKSEKGYWRIQRGYSSGVDALIKKIYENRNARWSQPKKNKDKKIEDVGKKHIVVESKDDKKSNQILIDNSQLPVELNIQIGKINIIIKIGGK